QVDAGHAGRGGGEHRDEVRIGRPPEQAGHGLERAEEVGGLRRDPPAAAPDHGDDAAHGQRSLVEGVRDPAGHVAGGASSVRNTLPAGPRWSGTATGRQTTSSAAAPHAATTACTRRSAAASATAWSGASTMTRTIGSVPLGRTSTRPVSPRV